MFEDIDVPSLLKTLDPKARDKLRRVVVRDLNLQKADLASLDNDLRRTAVPGVAIQAPYKPDGSSKPRMAMPPRNVHGLRRF